MADKTTWKSPIDMGQHVATRAFDDAIKFQNDLRASELTPDYNTQTADNYAATGDDRLYRDGERAYKALQKLCELQGIRWRGFNVQPSTFKTVPTLTTLDKTIRSNFSSFGSNDRRAFLQNVPSDMLDTLKLYLASAPLESKHADVATARHMLLRYIEVWTDRWIAASKRGYRERGTSATLRDYAGGLTTPENTDLSKIPQDYYTAGADYGVGAKTPQDLQQYGVLQALIEQIYVNGFDPSGSYASDASLDKLVTEFSKYFGEDLYRYLQTGQEPAGVEGRIAVREHAIQYMTQLLRLMQGSGFRAVAQKRQDLRKDIADIEKQIEKLKQRQMRQQAGDSKVSATVQALSGTPSGQVVPEARNRESDSKRKSKIDDSFKGGSE